MIYEIKRVYKGFVKFYNRLLLEEEYFFFEGKNNELDKSSVMSQMTEKQREKWLKFYDYGVKGKENEKVQAKFLKMNKFVLKMFKKVGYGSNPKTIDGDLADFPIYISAHCSGEEVKLGEKRIDGEKYKCVVLPYSMQYEEIRKKAEWVLALNILSVEFEELKATDLGVYYDYRSKVEFIVDYKFFDKYISFTKEGDMEKFFKARKNNVDFSKYLITQEDMLAQGYLTNSMKVLTLFDLFNNFIRDKRFSINKKMLPLQMMGMELRDELSVYEREVKDFVGFYLVDSKKSLIGLQNEFVDSQTIMNVYGLIVDVLGRYTTLLSKLDKHEFKSAAGKLNAVLELPNKPFEEKELVSVDKRIKCIKKPLNKETLNYIEGLDKVLIINERDRPQEYNFFVGNIATQYEVEGELVVASANKGKLRLYVSSNCSEKEFLGNLRDIVGKHSA